MMGSAEWPKSADEDEHAEEIVKVAVDCDVPVVFMFSADSLLLKVQQVVILLFIIIIFIYFFIFL